MLSDPSNFIIFAWISDDICYPLALTYPLQYAERLENVITR